MKDMEVKDEKKNVLRQVVSQVIEEYKWYVYVVATVALMVKHHYRGEKHD